jgi:aryl-alcohol dehydrogenase-like predicted oxidoreductase
MRYVEFGRSGIQVFRLGFGCMRLPSYQKDGKTVYDEEASIALLRRAYELVGSTTTIPRRATATP